MKISSVISESIDSVSSNIISADEAKKHIARTVYWAIIESRTIGELTSREKEMVCDVCDLMGMRLTIGTDRVVGRIGKDDVNGKVF